MKKDYTLFRIRGSYVQVIAAHYMLKVRGVSILKKKRRKTDLKAKLQVYVTL
jgi:uncharacterized C2H2 Zn-finger protein